MISLPFEPDYAVHPAVTLLEMLSVRQWEICDLTDDPVEQLAIEMYIASSNWDLESRKGLLLGDLVELLGRTIGPSADYWRRRESDYLNQFKIERN